MTTRSFNVMKTLQLLTVLRVSVSLNLKIKMNRQIGPYLILVSTFQLQ